MKKNSLLIFVLIVCCPEAKTATHRITVNETVIALKPAPPHTWLQSTRACLCHDFRHDTTPVKT
jgi:hypothetical protein